jgi:hypothetical protein
MENSNKPDDVRRESAVDRVFCTFELCEAILLLIDPYFLPPLLGVSRIFNATILASPVLSRALFLQPGGSDGPVTQQNFNTQRLFGKGHRGPERTRYRMNPFLCTFFQVPPAGARVELHLDSLNHSSQLFHTQFPPPSQNTLASVLSSPSIAGTSIDRAAEKQSQNDIEGPSQQSWYNMFLTSPPLRNLSLTVCREDGTSETLFLRTINWPGNPPLDNDPSAHPKTCGVTAAGGHVEYASPDMSYKHKRSEGLTLGDVFIAQQIFGQKPKKKDKVKHDREKVWSVHDLHSRGVEIHVESALAERSPEGPSATSWDIWRRLSVLNVKKALAAVGF